MAEIAQKDRPERKIYNAASPGDVEILRHRGEIGNFVHADWGTPSTPCPYDYGCARPRGECYIPHYSGQNWHEFNWKSVSRLLNRFHVSEIMRRSVAYKTCENDHFAFVEFAWNPELELEDYADMYVTRRLRKKDEDTSALYRHWIEAQGYRYLLQHTDWRKSKKPSFPS